MLCPGGVVVSAALEEWRPRLGLRCFIESLLLCAAGAAAVPWLLGTPAHDLVVCAGLAPAGSEFLHTQSLLSVFHQRGLSQGRLL